MKRFQDEFGDRCTNSSYDDICDPSSLFEMKCYGGWKISTSFWFGRGHNLIDYGHGIASELTFEQQGQAGPYAGSLVLGQMISLCSWLGICSQTQWPYISNAEELDRTCGTVIRHCRHFFDVAPNLLKGLEVENIAIG